MKNQQKIILTLYIAGQTPRCIAALNNIKKICETTIKGQYKINIVDLLESPEMASANKIVAIPTIIRTQPKPVKKTIGDLSDREHVISGLDLLI